MVIAATLGRSRSEVLAMSVSDYRWALAYEKVAQEKADKERRRGGSKPRRS